MRKYRITDEDGAEYEVEEVEEVKGSDEDVDLEPAAAEPEALSPEEIAALKKLAAAADQLIALIGTQDACKDEGEEEGDETIEEVDEDETEEQLVDTDENIEDARNTYDVELDTGHVLRVQANSENEARKKVEQSKGIREYTGRAHITSVKQVDSNEKIKGYDSKRSLGAIEKKRAVVDNSLNDDISDAWAKRFGGVK